MGKVRPYESVHKYIPNTMKGSAQRPQIGAQNLANQNKDF